MTVTDFTPLRSAAGGALIGLSAVLLMLFTGRIAGIVGIVRRAFLRSEGSRSLEAASFIAGLVFAPVLYERVTGLIVEQSVSSNIPLLAISGLLVGFGSAWANGCTSGHGVCGLSRGSIRSMAATAIFMAVAVTTVLFTRV